MLQIYTGELRDLDMLSLEELPLEKISFRGKEIFAISEMAITTWLERNTFDIYSLDCLDEDEEILTYEDVVDADITLDYSVIQGFMAELGFKLIYTSDVIQYGETDDANFENTTITPDEAIYLKNNPKTAGDGVFLLENTDISTIKLFKNTEMYDYN